MTVTGSIEATGVSYVPTEVCVWVNLTQFQMDSKEQIVAITDNPPTMAANGKGDDSEVEGSGSLHILPSTLALSV